MLAHAIPGLPQAFHRGESARERGRPSASRRARRSLRGCHRRHRGHQVEGALRDDGGSHRSLRGRVERRREHHPQDGLSRAAGSPMSGTLFLVLFIILVALAFDYINGFHDAANSIATVVSTRVLTPMQAVAWAAFFNFVAAFGFGVQVAKTVGKGVVESGVVDQWVILGGLAGAIIWNLVTWYYGIPSSSSHALIGGFAGAAVAKAGWSALVVAGLVKITLFIVLAPVLGMALGFVLMVLMFWIFRSARPS